MNTLYITALIAAALGLQTALSHATNSDSDRAYREAVDRIVERSADEAAGGDNGPVVELARATVAEAVDAAGGVDASSREMESIDCFYEATRYHPACETGREEQ